MSEINIGSIEFRIEGHEKWVKLFSHNSSGEVFFSSKSEALFCNSPQKYSILGLLDYRFLINGVFEFLLEYPNEHEFYRWQQTSNPITTQEVVGVTTKESIGYRKISGNDGYWNWGGLVLSSTDYTLLDGSIGHENWCVAIGSLIAFIDEDSFPGNCEATKLVQLWVLTHYTSICSCNFAYYRSHISIMFFVLMFLQNLKY